MSQRLVQRACTKLRTAIEDEAVVRLNFTGDLREMLDALEVIQPTVEDVEKFRFIYSGVLWGWLGVVTHQAYRIMDMVDDLQGTTAPAAATMTRMLPRLAIKKYDMATKVNEITNEMIKLKEYYISRIAEDMPAIARWYKQHMYNRVTVPSFVEGSVFGREADKQRIVALLLSAASNITRGHPSCTILPIFGLPGSGKTTLAQMVFKDDTHSLKEYTFRVWVNVSLEFDLHRIVESILRQVVSGGENEEIKKRGSNSDVMGMEHIMTLLHKMLNGKMLLLVLDDLWEEDPIQLQLLKSMLTSLGGKVDVIVTTRNQAIARKICTIVQPYRLNPLDDDTCSEIIKKLIRFEVEDAELEKIVPKIASKCRGVPLAAVEYARVLVASLGPELSQLGALQDLTKSEKNMERYFRTRLEALPNTFFLSYASMPPELKLCIDYYCGIFPNGHNIVKDDLLHQWIAHDFIESSERSSAIEIAEGYITRLLDMSFFQTAKSDHTSGNDDKGAAIFTMHDMVHRYLSSMRDPWQLYSPYMLVTNFRGKLHYDHDYVRALHCINCCNLVFNDASFSSELRSLRTLILKESPVPKLPDSIRKLRHLRYLKITEFSGLVSLPEAFGDLTNLFHIDLSNCSALATLPGSLGKLIGLVHINLSGCSGLTALPESFGDLINLSHVNLSRCHGLAEFPELLQKLGKLVHLDLSFWSCFQGIGKGLGGLTNLEHLNLSNPCCHLAQQRSQLQELEYGLSKLIRLRYLNLSMCLNPIFYYMSEEDRFQYIKSCVTGLSSLEHLDLSHNTFLFGLPQSLGALDRLHTLDLSGCIRLKKLGTMKSLKFISVRNCRAMQSCNFAVCIDEDAAAYSSSNLLQLEEVNCKEFRISCLEKVRSTEEAQTIKLAAKEKLEKLKLSWTMDSRRSVEDSALLGELTPPPNLQLLEINGYDGTSLPEYLSDLTSLEELQIVCCKQVSSLPDNIEKLSSLKNLCIFGCPELEKWCQLEENKKMLAHIPNKNYGEHGSTSRPEMEEDDRSTNEVEAA